MESMECLNEDAKKKKRGRFMYIRGGDAKIATDTKSLDSRCMLIMYLMVML